MSSFDLILLTNAYPYGKGEEFLEEEILYLGRQFKNVHIISRSKDNQLTRAVPDNVSHEILHPGLSLSFLFYALFSKDYWFELLACLLESGKFFKSLRRITSFFLVSYGLSKHLETLDISANAVGYSYWSNAGALALVLSRRLFRKIICRAHSYELYVERSALNFIPFRSLLYNFMDYIYFVSEHGRAYFANRYSGNVEKLKVSYLGVPRFSPNIHLGKASQKPFHLVSCSSVVPVKRLELLVAGLKLVQVPISWTHIGSFDTVYGSNLFKLANEFCSTSSFVNCSFLGYIPHEDVLRFYSSNNISAFVNVSEYEGLAVSVMEACSFGIPVLATDVGGMSEIVINEHNGFLLAANPTPKDIAETLERVSAMEIGYFRDLCEKSFKIWENKFDALRNYSNFAKELSQ